MLTIFEEAPINPGFNVTEYVAFARAVREVVEAILDSLEQNPIVSGPPGPKDWPKTQAMLRNAADDLMLCLDVRSTVEKLRGYPPAMILLPTFLTELEDEFLVQIMQNAFLARPSKSDVLPGQSIAKRDNPPLWRKDHP
jgi:hypothetical protein